MHLQPWGSHHWGLWQLVAWAFSLLVMCHWIFFIMLYSFFSFILYLNLSEFVPMPFCFYYMFASGNLYTGHSRDHYWPTSITFCAWKSLYLFSVCSSSQSDCLLELHFPIHLFTLRSYLLSRVTGVWFLGVYCPHSTVLLLESLSLIVYGFCSASCLPI